MRCYILAKSNTEAWVWGRLCIPLQASLKRLPCERHPYEFMRQTQRLVE